MYLGSIGRLALILIGFAAIGSCGESTPPSIPQTAVENVMQAIDKNIELAIFPRSMRYITRALNHLPKPVLNWILRSKLDKTT